MRLIDADALEKFLADAEMEATRRRKYVLAGALNTVQGNLRNFPTTEPEPHWIPCSERLPEKDEWDNAFLVTIQCEHVDGWEDYYVSGAEYSEYGWEYTPCPVGAIKVVAWMIVSISPYQPAPHCTNDYCEIEEVEDGFTKWAKSVADSYRNDKEESE